MQAQLFTEDEIPTSRPAFAKQLLPAATGRENALQDWKEAYPFKYHLLRVSNGIVYHVNTVFEGYNDHDYPITNYETPMAHYAECNDVAALNSIIREPKAKGRQTQYILSKLEWSIIKSLYAVR